MIQIPAGAEGVAVAVLLWSFFCLFVNLLLQWLLWTGNERRSYIFLVTCVAFLATLTSIIEQIYNFYHYEDMLFARLAWVKANVENAMVLTTNGTVPGVDLAMSMTRWGCYIAECGFAFFWSFRLCQAVYGWSDDPRYGEALKAMSELGKPLSILGSVFTMGVLQTEGLQRSLFWWPFVFHFLYASFCVGALFWFLLMFIEYFQTRRLFRRMNSQQRRDWERQPSPVKGRRSSSVATSWNTGRMTSTSDHFGALAQRQGGIYDKYLIARTFIPLFGLAIFELENILSNRHSADKVRALALTTAPDLSVRKACGYFGAFVPGCLASLILALAFGTTKANRDRCCQLFMPTRLQSTVRQLRYRKATDREYQAMDSDNGILSRQKRLSMEKRLRIEVTYEFEIRNESVAVAPPSEAKPVFWDGAATMLPQQPPASVSRDRV